MEVSSYYTPRGKQPLLCHPGASAPLHMWEGEEQEETVNLEPDCMHPVLVKASYRG